MNQMTHNELLPRQPIEEYQCDKCKRVFNIDDTFYIVQIDEELYDAGQQAEWVNITKLCKECIESKYTGFNRVFDWENRNRLIYDENVDLDKDLVLKVLCNCCNKEIKWNDKVFTIFITGYIVEEEYLAYGEKLEWQSTGEVSHMYTIAKYCDTCYENIKDEISLKFIHKIAKEKQKYKTIQDT